MIRCESIGCPDRAYHNCSFFNWEGELLQMKLCDLHRDQLTRHSWYVNTASLYSVVIKDFDINIRE